MLDLAYGMGASGQSGGSESLGFLGFLPFLFIFVLFYLLIIRPQQRKQREHQRKIDSLSKGDRIITTSGIYGTVVGISDDKIQVRIAEKVKVDMLKNAVATILKPESAEEKR